MDADVIVLTSIIFLLNGLSTSATAQQNCEDISSRCRKFEFPPCTDEVREHEELVIYNWINRSFDGSEADEFKCLLCKASTCANTTLKFYTGLFPRLDEITRARVEYHMKNNWKFLTLREFYNPIVVTRETRPSLLAARLSCLGRTGFLLVMCLVSAAISGIVMWLLVSVFFTTGNVNI